MSHCFAVGSIAERTPAKYLCLPTFMFCCQKMAIKIKEIKPRTVSVECLCTHVIVVHSMKLMIRSTSPFEKGPGGMPVDLLLWFFNNVPSRVNTHSHSQWQSYSYSYSYSKFIHKRRRAVNAAGQLIVTWAQKPQKLELQNRALYLQSAAATKSTSASTPASTTTANCNCDADCGADRDYVRSG